MSTYSETPTTAQADNPRPKKLIRSQYKDIMVKVDDDVYYLDRLQLALKSGYFEKLFIEDYSEKNSDLIELPLIDTDTFSAVVDIIYGEKLTNVIKPDNFISLLMAMDYLQMHINSDTYKRYVNKQLGQHSLNNDTFKLYFFIAEDPKFEYLLPVVFEHLSINLELERIPNFDEFLCIKFEHFLQIIKQRRTNRYSPSEFHHGFKNFSKICAKWICHDMENRLIRTIDIINAIRYRFVVSNSILSEDLNLYLSTNDQIANQDIVSRFVYNRLVSFGEVHCPMLDILDVSEEKLETEKTERRYRASSCCDHDYQVNVCSELEPFLRNSYLYDITVSVGEKVYKLHRSVLKSASAYFEEILSIEYSEISAHCEGVPTAPSKDKIYFVNEVDSVEFDIIIDYIYWRKKEFAPDTIFRVFKAVHILKIDGRLKDECDSWMRSHYKDLCTEDVSEILKFTQEKVEYKYLNRYVLYEYIVDSWPKVTNLPQLADFFAAITLPGETHVKENEAYFFDKIDRKTFEVIVRFIIREEHNLLCEDNIVGVLKASETYKMEELTKECVNWLTYNSKDISFSDDSGEILHFIRRNTRYEGLHLMYLVQHLKKMPEVDVEMLCAISYDSLENVLMSYEFHVDDPSEILNMCSLWVTHDAENRYHLIPRIAYAIKRKYVMNDDDNHSIAIPVDFNRCSLDFVKNKLWEILRSISVLPLALSSPENKVKKRRIEQPVFITSKIGGPFSILNSDWDEIASFCLCENVLDVKPASVRRGYDDDFKYLMSATMIDDNLFILCRIDRTKNYYFYAYNLSSNKLCSLACDLLRLSENKLRQIASSPFQEPLEFTLLNCCNEIYCCLENGEVLKYSFEYNRWIQISTCLPGKYEICFASDGNQLYRMYKSTRTDITTNYAVEVYDFQQNSWSVGLNLPSLSRDESDETFKNRTLRSLVFLNDHGLVALFSDFLYELHQEAGWQVDQSLPYDYTHVVKRHRCIHQNKSGEMLFVIDNKLYELSRTHERWELKIEWPLEESEVYSGQMLPYENMIGIHNPRING